MSSLVEAQPLGDQGDRKAAVLEKKRNVLIDAGAGTGKTTILIRRIVELLAPRDDAQPALSIDRLAALTFTRRAAGELRLRAREELLRALANGPSAIRAERLRAALVGLDTAHVGTIHAFADRLLRAHPAEANLSPTYEIREDTWSLVREATGALVRGAERGDLAQHLPERSGAATNRAREAEETIRLFLRAGLPLREKDTWFYTVWAGLDSLVAAFVDARDQLPADPALFEPDLDAFRRVAGAYCQDAAALVGGSAGSDWLRQNALQVQGLLEEEDPAALLAELHFLLGRAPDYKKGAHFQDDNAGWAVWNKLWKAAEKNQPSYDDAMSAPLRRWMAHRLVRLFPVVVALYEAAKARAQVVDHLDLLLKLRDLLRDHAAARSGYQHMFDHILVDEFQDTDPLQAEVLLYLSAAPGSQLGDVWEDATPRPGTLTLVGDPKQSIYRFRRADIATYDRMWQLIRKGVPLEVRLAANFRSRSELIAFANHRFEDLLGTPPAPGQLFDAAAGEVFHKPLEAGRATDGQKGSAGATGASVHVVPLATPSDGDTGVDSFRAIEGQALARYLRWLKEQSGLTIQDPLDGRRRSIEFGDVAVLAFSTFTLPFLFEAFDGLGVPYSSRGGKLFLSDPLHQQFLLGLRALSDGDDGVALAALLRPPFFALDPMDLLLERHGPDGGDVRALRAREAKALVRELRQRRFAQSAGATARDLLENTGFGRFVALGPNGAQRLERLRELCLQLDRRAVDEGVDFDAVSATARAWVTDPVQLDAPHPVGTDAVQVLTVHQAKGLEWPVVVLWDGCASLTDRERPLVWKTGRGGRSWILALRGFEWEEPADGELKQRDLKFENAQRKRLVYVAGTRARDLMILALPDEGPKSIARRLLDNAPAELMIKVAPFGGETPAPWSVGINPPPPPDAGQIDTDTEAVIEKDWREAALESSRAWLAPQGISSAAHEVVGLSAAGDEAVTNLPPKRSARFGAVFGETVHRAIGIFLRGEAPTAEAAVASAARRAGLDAHHAEAVADVERAVVALRPLGVTAPIGPEVRLEYPVAAQGSSPTTLLAGYVDLVVVRPDEIIVVDFKSDTPPTDAIEVSHPEYVEQVRTYARILALVAGKRLPTAALLFTGDGSVRWVATTG